MKTKFTLLFLTIFYCANLFAQSKLSLTVNTGYTFNSNIKLGEKVVENSNGYLLDIGIQRSFFNQLFVKPEIGFSFKNIFSSGNTDGRNYSSRTFRVAAPVKLVFPLLKEKLNIAAGCIFQNNVDFSEFDFRLRDKYSWRADYILETRYYINDKWLLSAGFSQNIRDIPDPYFVNDPKTAIRLGVILNLGKSES